MTQRLHLLTIGEVVIDMISTAPVASLGEALSFQRFTGGSPANIAVNVARLGFQSALMARVGKDPLGSCIRKDLTEQGVNLQGLQEDPHQRTSIIFIARGPSNPQVSHHRMADRYLQISTVGRDLVQNSRMVHFSGFALSASPARRTLEELKEEAKKRGKILAFDPCFHEPLWRNPKKGRTLFQEFIAGFSFIKPSLEDMKRLFGPITPEEGIRRYHQLGAENVILTMGEKGVLFSHGQSITHLKGQEKIPVDVTGAGDSFWAGFYTGLLTDLPVREAILRGMKAAEITIQHLGAIAPLSSFAPLIKDRAISLSKK